MFHLNAIRKLYLLVPVSWVLNTNNIYAQTHTHTQTINMSYFLLQLLHYYCLLIFIKFT